MCNSHPSPPLPSPPLPPSLPPLPSLPPSPPLPSLPPSLPTSPPSLPHSLPSFLPPSLPPLPPSLPPLPSLTPFSLPPSPPSLPPPPALPPSFPPPPSLPPSSETRENKETLYCNFVQPRMLIYPTIPSLPLVTQQIHCPLEPKQSPSYLSIVWRNITHISSSTMLNIQRYHRLSCCCSSFIYHIRCEKINRTRGCIVFIGCCYVEKCRVWMLYPEYKMCAFTNPIDNDIHQLQFIKLRRSN